MIAIDIYIHYFSTIGHIIQDLVDFIFLKKQRLHLRILIESSECEWGETDNWLHPFALAVNVLNPTNSFHITNGSQIPLCGRKIRVPEDNF